MTTLHSSVEALDDDVEVVSNLFHERGYTDGLPVVPPTRERVVRMLAGTDRRPDETLGEVPPVAGPATVEKIAVNAVMAGCRPEYLPLVLTAFELLLRPSFLLDGMQPTTNPLTPMLIVNGPIRGRIGLNCATGVMGPGWQANATIGRAIRLALINLGGARPGDVDKCTQGFVGKYTLCVGENEEESPWAPLHVERGFAPEQDVVTVVGVNAVMNIHDSSGEAADLVKTLCGSLPSIGTPNVIDPHSTPVLALNPLHATILRDGAGFTKEELKRYLVAHTSLPADALSKRRAHLREEEGTAHFLVDGRIPITNRPENLLVVVTGGMGGGHSAFLPAGHYGQALSAPVGP